MLWADGRLLTTKRKYEMRTEFDLKAEGRQLHYLNLYCGLGGNRKLLPSNVKVTAVELNPEIAKFYSDHYPHDKVIVADAHDYLLNHYQEFDFIWSSVNCPTHSRARFWAAKGGKFKAVFPDMKLYEEILFLDNYFDGQWTVENVKPFYTPLLPPKAEIGRHLFWSNFRIHKTAFVEADINRGNIGEWQALHEIDISGYKFSTRKDKLLRNCVHPELGLHVFNCAVGAFKSNSIHQHELWNTD